ncbi:MAG: nickel pincer cofactor biosynthesis protein LarC [Deltaproteobacteria bacterium]|nr:nickel pincer cofactor biosynthesis protein LarC [Deltaproteobacteria bacterium]
MRRTATRSGVGRPVGLLPPGPRAAWVDAAGGVAGDMLLGACLDALARRDGRDPAATARAFLRDLARRLGLRGVRFAAAEVRRGGFRGLQLEVRIDARAHPHERTPGQVAAIVRRARFSPAVRAAVLAVFARLAAAEAEAHGKPVSRIHLHEVGAVDAIVDVVGTVAALEALGVGTLHGSVLPQGTGTVRAAHGELPLPAPAAALLLRGLPVRGVAVDGETVTPTGAALVATLAGSFGAMPAMTVEALGVGAGTHDRPGIANLTRLFVGRPAPAAGTGAVGGGGGEVLVEANIDDMTPELYDHALERLFEAGALDAFVTPILMKKGRPAHTLSVLVERAKLEPVLTALFRETTSIGCRLIEVQKRALERAAVDVRTPWGTIPVKLSLLGGEVLGRRPEYDACRRLARAAGVPLRAVVEAATAAAGRLVTPARRRPGPGGSRR